jgi:putative ABC transport system substrate-binding protein
MRRRELIQAALAAPFAAVTSALAQPVSGRVPRVGILTPASGDQTPVFKAFRDALRELGYVEGRTIALEFRFADGDLSRLPHLAEELVSLPVDIIVADGTSALIAAGKATTTIPIVLAAGLNPTMVGLVTTDAHPGGNVTGFTLMATELNAKRLQLLQPLIQAGAAVAALIRPSPAATAYLADTEAAASRMGLRIHPRVEPSSPESLRALAPSVFAGAAGVVVLPDAMFWNLRRDIVALVAAARLPAVYPEREYADDGGLMAYGPNVLDNFRRTAGYVDRILKGARVADLPIQEPAKFDLVINLKTAKALGLTVPQLLLASADEVIE